LAAPPCRNVLDPTLKRRQKKAAAPGYITFSAPLSEQFMAWRLKPFRPFARDTDRSLERRFGLARHTQLRATLNTEGRATAGVSGTLPY